MWKSSWDYHCHEFSCFLFKVNESFLPYLGFKYPTLALTSCMAHRLRQAVSWDWHEYVELLYTRIKCNFFLKQVTVLSHTVTSKSYKVEPSLTKQINTFLHERLKYIRGIRKLLGRLGCLRRHIPNFSAITQTVYNLLTKPMESDAKPLVRKSATNR